VIVTTTDETTTFEPLAWHWEREPALVELTTRIAELRAELPKLCNAAQAARAAADSARDEARRVRALKTQGERSAAEARKAQEAHDRCEVECDEAEGRRLVADRRLKELLAELPPVERAAKEAAAARFRAETEARVPRLRAALDEAARISAELDAIHDAAERAFAWGTAESKDFGHAGGLGQFSLGWREFRHDRYAQHGGRFGAWLHDAHNVLGLDLRKEG
jgi:hypothetical protein